MSRKSKIRVTVIGVALFVACMMIPAAHVSAAPIVDPIQIDSGLISGTVKDAIKPAWQIYDPIQAKGVWRYGDEFMGAIGE